MPQVYTQIQPETVMEIIQSRGYRGHNNRNAFQLTKAHPDPTQVWKHNGQRKRLALQPVSIAHYSDILRRANSAQEAADQLIALSEGSILSPQLGGNQQPAFDSETVERMVKARAENAVVAQTQGLQSIIARQQQQIDELKLQMEQAAKANEKRKPGRPKGSKNRYSNPPHPEKIGDGPADVLGG